jgi:hypothetical protein
MAIVRVRTGNLSLIRTVSRTIPKTDHTMGKVNRMLWDLVRFIGFWLTLHQWRMEHKKSPGEQSLVQPGHFSTGLQTH